MDPGSTQPYRYVYFFVSTCFVFVKILSIYLTRVRIHEVKCNFTPPGVQGKISQ